MTILEALRLSAVKTTNPESPAPKALSLYRGLCLTYCRTVVATILKTSKNTEKLSLLRVIEPWRQKAGEGIRTLDIQLGKLSLYQLSYAREQ